VHLRRGGREHGASAVEFALVLPILVLLVFGIITFGIVFARSQGMEAAAREGARMASLGRGVERVDVERAVQNTTVPFIDGEIGVAISPTDKDWCASTESFVTVTVSVVAADNSLTIPLFGDISTSYEASGTFRCEAPHD